MSRCFSKRVEDFTCEKCRRDIKGNGFTNHCPGCLWSKHVDISPGDRSSLCLGLMEPVNVTHETGEYILIHKCIACGYIKRNKLSADDNFDRVVDVSKIFSNKMM